MKKYKIGDVVLLDDYEGCCSSFIIVDETEEYYILGPNTKDPEIIGSGFYASNQEGLLAFRKDNFEPEIDDEDYNDEEDDEDYSYAINLKPEEFEQDLELEAAGYKMVYWDKANREYTVSNGKIHFTVFDEGNGWCHFLRYYNDDIEELRAKNEEEETC